MGGDDIECYNTVGATVMGKTQCRSVGMGQHNLQIKVIRWRQRDLAIAAESDGFILLHGAYNA
jgi:hypothetical protein